MGNLNYFLCSKAVVEIFAPAKVSKPFKSGYAFDKEDDYYVAVLDGEAAEKYYEEIIEPQNENSSEPDIDFWFRECVGGTMDASKIKISDCKRNGLFLEIERHLNLTNEKNRALVIKNLSSKYGITPIELINRIAL